MLSIYFISEAPSVRKNSTWSVLKTIYSKNGVKGMFAGVIPRVIKVAPACAIMVSTFEYGKSFFENHNWTEYKRVKNKDISA